MGERQRGRDPNCRGHREQEAPLPEYRHAVKFPNEPTSNTGYEATRHILYTEDCDLSLYRTVLLPSQSWHVLVLGRIPTEEVQEHIYQALERGEAVELPEEVWRAFNQRRLEQSGKGPWVERRSGGRRLR